jgi:hypothetical protein
MKTTVTAGPNGAQHATRPVETIIAKSYKMGNRWSHVRDTARDLYGTDRSEVFNDVGLRAKVFYTY